jgi:hypothetical protein
MEESGVKGSGCPEGPSCPEGPEVVGFLAVDPGVSLVLFLSAGSFWPTLPRCASVPPRQHPLCIDQPNLYYFIYAFHASTRHETGHIWQIHRPTRQSPSRSLLIPRDSALSFQLCGIPALEIGSRCASGLRLIVPTHLQTASELRAMEMSL